MATNHAALVLTLTRLDDRCLLSRWLAAADGIVYTSNGSFQPFDNYTGVLNVSLAGDLDGDGFEEIAVGAGPGGGPRLSIINSHTQNTLANLFAYEPTFRGGVTVAVDGSRRELLAGSGPGGAAVVATYTLDGFRETGRRFIGDPQSRTGVVLDADAIEPDLPPIDIYDGALPIYVDTDGLNPFERVRYVTDIADQLDGIADAVHITTTEPDGYPSNYVTLRIRDLSYLPQPVTGLATATYARTQPDSYNYVGVYVGDDVSPDHRGTVGAHEIGHALGLMHDDDMLNTMFAPVANGSRFRAQQFDAMRVAIASR